MNVTKKVRQLFAGLSGAVDYDSSRPNRILQCRHCSSIEIHNPKFINMHGKTCRKGCEVCDTKMVGVKPEDLVEKPIQCNHCGSKRGFNFTDDSGVEDAERNEHEMYAKGKASLLQADEEVEVLDDYESEVAESTQLVENKPAVQKAELDKQVFTIEPQDGFDSSGFPENDLSHKGNIHETCYAPLVNPGNTPHMQKKIPIDELVDIRDNTQKAILYSWQPKTYGSSLLNKECKSKMGFSLECLNTGNRKLSDQAARKALTGIYFGQEKIKEIKEIQLERKPTRDETKDRLKAEETVGRLIGVLKTGNASCGHQSPMYETKINDYDPVSFEKLALELDIPWTENVLDTHELAKRVEQEIEDVWRYNYVM